MKNEIHMLQSTGDTICNSFLITTEDGRLLAIDGGYEKETDHFLDYLKKLNSSDAKKASSSSCMAMTQSARDSPFASSSFFRANW